MPALVGWFVAQVLKFLITLFKDKKLDFGRLMGSGGMPSSHSAFVMALATSCGLFYGWDGPVFGISLVLAFIVMYDAAGVRRAAGKQAALLNQLVEDLFAYGVTEKTNVQLKELLGHTPFQVFAGALLGIIIAILFVL